MPYIPKERREELLPIIIDIVEETKKAYVGRISSLCFALTIEKLFDKWSKRFVYNAGDKNYAMCELLIRLYDLHTTPSYSSIDAAMGALDYMKKLSRSYDFYILEEGTISCAQAEIYRRIAAPYEDYCIEKNGDLEVFEIFKETLIRKMEAR